MATLRKEFVAPASATSGIAAYDLEGKSKRTYARAKALLRGKKRIMATPKVLKCSCCDTSHSVLKAAPMPPTKRWVLDHEPAVAKALAKVMAGWSKKVAAQIAVHLPKKAAEKSDLRQLLRKDDSTDAQIQAILDAIELEGFALDIAEEIRPELEAAFKAGGISGATLIDLANDKSIVEQIPEAAVDWARDRAAELVGMSWDKDTQTYAPNPDATMSITETTRDGLRGAVGQALEEGWSAADLADNLADNYEFSDARSETIARTELAFAHVQGNLDTWDKSGVVGGKRWILADTHPGADECDDYADEDVISMDAQFGGEIDGPPAHPNCLCALEPVLSDDMEQMDKGDLPGHEFHGSQYGVGGELPIKETAAKERYRLNGELTHLESVDAKTFQAKFE